MHPHPRRPGRRGAGPGQPFADRMGDRDMRDAAGAEEGVLARDGAVDELVDQHEIARRHLIAKRSAGGDADHVRHAQPLQRVDVGAVGDRGGAVTMPAPVARQEGQRGAIERTGQHLVRCRAPGAVHSLPPRILQPIDLVEAGPADDADHGLGHVASRSLHSGAGWRATIGRSSEKRCGTDRLGRALPLCTGDRGPSDRPTAGRSAERIIPRGASG